MGTVMDVRAIQINFADDALPIASPGKIQGSETQPRYIEERACDTLEVRRFSGWGGVFYD